MLESLLTFLETVLSIQNCSSINYAYYLIILYVSVSVCINLCRCEIAGVVCTVVQHFDHTSAYAKIHAEAGIEA